MSSSRSQESPNDRQTVIARADTPRSYAVAAAIASVCLLPLLVVHAVAGRDQPTVLVFDALAAAALAGVVARLASRRVVVTDDEVALEGYCWPRRAVRFDDVKSVDARGSFNHNEIVIEGSSGRVVIGDTGYANLGRVAHALLQRLGGSSVVTAAARRHLEHIARSDRG